MNILKISKNVKFINSNSIDYLNNTKIKYDFIFLDGSHKSEIVFQEIILSIGKIRENGLILLHDYFDKGKTIWENKPILFGPYLALKKIIKKNNNLEVYPIKQFPWETKLNSKKTSLAILFKK